MEDWPASESQVERSLLRCAIFLFRNMRKSEPCRKELRDLLGPGRFGQLLALLSFVHVFHLWLGAFPEISYDKEPVVREYLFSLLRRRSRQAKSSFANCSKTRST